MSVELLKTILVNLDQSMLQLREIRQFHGHPLYAEALTSRFRLTYETIKTLLLHYLAHREFKKPQFHRELLELGMQLEILPRDSIWFDMMADRNSLTHEYSPPDFEDICKSIEDNYANLLEQTHKNFSLLIGQI